METPDANSSIDAQQLTVVNWVLTQAELTAIFDELKAAQVVALDTEFIKRDTYYPKLALIQINTGKNIYLIDAPKLELAEFWKVLADLPLMVWHACGEDLGIFYLLSGLPTLTNVFDTQIGLAFITGQLQMGYQRALDDTLDVAVDKDQSQSDWLARPLTEEQEKYAADDVRFLLPLYTQVAAKLNEQGLYDKAMADCQMYAKELYNAQNVADEDQYLTVADYRYSGKQLAFLRELMAWREAVARATNKPRTFIIRKQAVRELVEHMPKSKNQLKQHTSVHRQVIDAYGNEILKLVEQSDDIAPELYPERIIPPYRSKEKTIKKAVDAYIQDYSDQTGIPKNVLMRKKWLTDLYEMVALDGDESTLPDGLLGWRKELVIDELVPVLTDYKDKLRAGMGLKL